MKKLYRCRWNRKVLGVLGGLGVYLNLDPTLLRVIFVALILPTGIFILPVIYLIVSVILPEGPKNYIQPRCKLLFRSIHDRKIAGICAGLASYFSIDATILRLVCIVITVFTAFFPMIIAYLACIMIIPEKPTHTHHF